MHPEVYRLASLRGDDVAVSAPRRRGSSRHSELQPGTERLIKMFRWEF